MDSEPLFSSFAEESKDGAQSLVVISSAASFYTNPKVMSATYSLSKLTADRMIEHIHEAHKDAGVSAYAIQPGGVKTDLAMDIPEGKGWEDSEFAYCFLELVDIDLVELSTSPDMAGGFLVWLTSERREWLSSRYLDARWDVQELLKRKEEVLSKDLLKIRLIF